MSLIFFFVVSLGSIGVFVSVIYLSDVIVLNYCSIGASHISFLKEIASHKRYLTRRLTKGNSIAFYECKYGESCVSKGLIKEVVLDPISNAHIIVLLPDSSERQVILGDVIK